MHESKLEQRPQNINVFVNMKYYTAFITHKQSAMTVKTAHSLHHVYAEKMVNLMH